MRSQTVLFTNSPEAQGNFVHEMALIDQGFTRIAGSDEVGRGPLAGPVVAASVILPGDVDPVPFLDSKKLSHKKRVALHAHLHKVGAHIGIGIVDVATIDEINILQSSLLAMRRSVEQLKESGHEPDFILVDGKFEIPLPTPQLTLIQGESKSGSIAAASIIAKVERDMIMDTLHKEYPVYGFKQHKGYPTKMHRQAIAEHGPCPHHRTTFGGVKQFV